MVEEKQERVIGLSKNKEYKGDQRAADTNQAEMSSEIRIGFFILKSVSPFLEYILFTVSLLIKI